MRGRVAGRSSENSSDRLAHGGGRFVQLIVFSLSKGGWWSGGSRMPSKKGVVSPSACAYNHRGKGSKGGWWGGWGEGAAKGVFTKRNVFVVGSIGGLRAWQARGQGAGAASSRVGRRLESGMNHAEGFAHGFEGL
jgi:hypothetical protein